MASGRAADREDPNKSRRKAARSLDRDPISELHQGQRSDGPHQRAGHMTAPDHFAEAHLNILRRRRPSTDVLCNIAAVASLYDAAKGLPNAPKDAIVGPPADERSTVSSVEEQDRLAWKPVKRIGSNCAVPLRRFK